MSTQSRPVRSVLYLPASKARALEKARSLPVDAIIFDLEDAVAPNEKAAAREALASALSQSYGPRLRVVRINGLDTEWGQEDARAAAQMDCDAVLLPKVESPDDLDALAELCPGKPLWAMMETPQGILNAAAIAAHPRMEGFVLGTNDLAKDLQVQATADRQAFLPALTMTVMSARAFGLSVLDGVFNDIGDSDGFEREARQGLALGFDGKTLIHPSQLATANTVFAPTLSALEEARAVIAAFDRPENAGKGVITVDGRMTESLHLEQARRVVAMDEAISALAGE